MTEATPPTGREERGTTPRRSLLGQAGREAGGLRSAGGGRQRERAGKTRGWGAAGLLPELAEDLPGAPDRSGGDARRGREGLEGALPRVPAAAEPVLSVDGGRRAHGGAVHQRLRGWTAGVHRCQGDLRRRGVLHGDDARRASGVRLEYLQRLPRRRRDNGGPDPVACARRRPNLRDGFPHRRLHGSGEEERIWTHVLKSLGAHFGVNEPVTLEKVCVDPKLQWSQVKNVWQNAGARSMLYTMVGLGRRMRNLLRRWT